jgi:hypothetical protein
MSILLTGAGANGLQIGPYTSAFVAVVVSRGGAVSAAEQGYLTTFENSLGADLVEFDRLWIHGLSDSIAARTSFVNPSSTLVTAVNSPTFTPSQGFTGNGSTSYLDSNFNPATNGIKYTQNNASFFVYERIYFQNYYIDIGNGNYPQANYIIPKLNLNGCYFACNAIGSNQASPVTDSKGLTICYRPNSTNYYLNKNGVIGSNQLAASLINNTNFYMLCCNDFGTPTVFSPGQISISGMGSANYNFTNFYNAVQTLGTSIGWAV